MPVISRKYSPSVRVKGPCHDPDHTPPLGAKVKNVWSYTSTLPIRLHGVVLCYTQGQLYILLLFTLCERSWFPTLGAHKYVQGHFILGMPGVPSIVS